MTDLAALSSGFGDGYDPGPERRRVAPEAVAAVLLALVAHIVLFGLLSVMWSTPAPPPPRNTPIEVSLVDTVALDQQAPSAAEPPAQSRAPDPGPPADAPPPAPAPAERVMPEPAPPKPAPLKPAAQPVLKPEPKPVPQKPVKVEQPVDRPKPAAKVEKPAEKPKPAAKPAAAPATKTLATTKTTGTSKTAKTAKPTGSLLDDDFRKGLSQSPSKSKAPDAAPGTVMNAAAAADIGSAIQRQVQPCANRQVNPGPGASRIVVTILLQLNRDGTLAARPTIADDHGGVDDENRRYVDAVDRNAIATFTGCAPLRGLPPELYDVPRGWKTFKLRYKLPG